MDKIINLLINNWTKGVDTYTHNGSTWLIFTEQRSWVIELTECKTLWYNYNFFKELFSLTSMDVVDNQHYITKWVEDNIIGGVKYTSVLTNVDFGELEEAIQNGVKRTVPESIDDSFAIEDTIQNGSIDSVRVNEYSLNYVIKQRDCEDTIENGVKETRLEMNITEGEVDDIIQDGVKHTEIGWHQCNNIDDAIENGVKETISTLRRTLLGVDDIIQNGVKETQFNSYENKSWIEGVIKKGVRHTLNTEYMPTSMVEDIIQSGVKHTEYGDWLDGDERLDDIVENGVKETNHVDVMKFFDNKMEDALENGVKLTGRIHKDYTEVVEYLIENGVKETKGHGFEQQNIIDDIVKDGVKETKTPGNGDIRSTIEWVEENKSNSYTKMIDDVIDNGVKEVVSYDEHKRGPVNTFGYIDDIIKEGEKINGTYAGGQRQSEKCKSVVEYGTKNPTD